jgi:hypothetical protein
LRTQKSKRRTVITLAHGVFEAHEIRKVCKAGSCPSVGSTELRKLVKPGHRYGYDLIVHVGLSRYLAGKQREEIRAVLIEKHGIALSAGTVSALCDRFLCLLESLHVHRAPQLRTGQQGSYPLHIDATCERGKGGLFICMDGWRPWVLWAGRIDSEGAEHLIPLIQKTVGLFGDPIAVVRDMGEGVAGAVKALREAGIPDLICHYHFLAAVGKKLMEKPHHHLRGMIQVARTRSNMSLLLRDLREYGHSRIVEGRFGVGRVRDELKALVLWVLEGDGRKDPPFPFGLTHLEFVRRCRQALERTEQWVPCPRTQPERRAIAHLMSLVARLERDQRLAPTVESLEQRWRTFSELRGVLRLSHAELPRGNDRYPQHQIPALELLRFEQIKRAVDDYQVELEELIPPEDRDTWRPKSAHAIILKYLKRYGARLFGHPVQRDPDGKVSAIVERTNNVIEYFFGQEKRQLRRRLGRAYLGRDLEQQPAQVALVSNLRCSTYVRLLCGSLDQLPAAFAELDIGSTARTAPPLRDHRNKQLQRCVRGLLNAGQLPSVTRADQLDRPAAPQLESVDLSLRWPELEALSDQQLREQCTELFAPGQKKAPKPRDPRLPPVGTVLTRRFRHHTHRVTVVEKGFEYRGRRYGGLSTVAKRITKTTYNGYVFFGLRGPWNGVPAESPRRRRDRRTVTQLAPVATES